MTHGESGFGALSIQLSVPAKINLWLEVIGKRSDGYHELSSLMLPIGVHDSVELEVFSGEGISLSCAPPGVPEDDRNLAWRAAELYLRAVEESSGVRIRLGKRIPAAAGLGGGSADAGAVLLGLNRLFNHRLPMDQLEDLALKLGADVPFFLHQRPVLATGVGERLQQVEGLPAYPLVLIKPPLAISTAWVYRSLKLTRGESSIKLRAFLDQPWRLEDVMQNDLETVTLEAHPELARMKEWLLDQGAAGALMSGSGPTVFGVFREKGQAERVALLARTVWKECWVAATETGGL